MKQLPEPEQKARMIEKRALDIAKDACVKYSRDLLGELFDKGFITQTDKRGACPILKKAGIDVSAVIADASCLNCKMPDCILTGKNHSRKILVPETADVYIQCECGVTATLHFIDDKLEKTRKFRQEDNQIIHSCGGICRKKG